MGIDFASLQFIMPIGQGLISMSAAHWKESGVPESLLRRLQPLASRPEQPESYEQMNNLKLGFGWLGALFVLAVVGTGVMAAMGYDRVRRNVSARLTP